MKMFISTQILHAWKQVICNFINNARKFTQKGYIHFGYLITEMLIQYKFVQDTGFRNSRKNV